jgi:hypothetical protein
MSAKLTPVAFKLSTSRACALVGFGARGRHRAYDRVSPWFGHLTGQLIGQLLSERRIVLFGGLILVSNQLESKPLPVSQKIDVSPPLKASPNETQSPTRGVDSTDESSVRD